MQIVLGKTVVGDFVVGKLESKKDLSNNEVPIIADVYSLVMIPNPNNREQMKTMILPLLYPFDDKAIKEVTFDKIFAVIDAPQDIQNVYIKVTTGIDVVPANTKIIQ
jgi:hypothetical protein